MNQAHVREVYLRVIDATIEGVRAELAEKGAESAIETLSILKKRWAERLHTHDFSDDPAIIDKSSSKNTSKKPSKKPDPNLTPKVPIKPPASRNGLISVKSLTNDTDESAAPPLPAVPRKSPPTPLSRVKADPQVVELKVEEPPLKRQRVPIDDGQAEDKGETLDSSDSDSESEDDEPAENLVLAQYEKVRKGPKWRLTLKEGIVLIRGREYLFNKASCDLDF